MKTRAVFLASVLILAATSALATSFVVPTDEEMVARANAIVIGTVEGSYVQESETTIETVYDANARPIVSKLTSGSTVHARDCSSRTEGSNGLSFDRRTNRAALHLDRTSARTRTGAEIGVRRPSAFQVERRGT